MNCFKPNSAILIIALSASLVSFRLLPESDSSGSGGKFKTIKSGDSTKIIYKSEEVWDCNSISSADLTVKSELNGMSKTTVERLAVPKKGFKADSTYSFYTTLINDQIVKVEVVLSPEFKFNVIGNTDRVTYSIGLKYKSEKRSRIKCAPVEVPINDTTSYIPCTEFDCAGAKGKIYSNN